MAQAENTELVERLGQFYRNYYADEIRELADRYPNEQRSLHVDWTDLYQFDPDIADDYLAQPDQLRGYAEEALRVYDLPVDVSLGQAHVRVRNLAEITEIRAIRARDVNTLVSVQGIVRKATDVRPKVEEAAFECQRCGTLTFIPQAGGFQEPHECQGCERQGPFSINFDQSTFVDAQKLRVQESPEGLRGGETPQSIDVHIEDDITGRVSPGDHVTVTGDLRIEQQTSGTEKSRMFDVYMEGHSLVVEDEEFESMDITAEDKRAIVELSREDGLYGRMVDSIAPTIWGYEQEKLAIALQLFGGVTKHLPDESRIRGDMHMLLVGDPGTGKCWEYGTNVVLADGDVREIGALVERNLTDPIPVDDGYFSGADFEVLSLQSDGEIASQTATRVWKRTAPDRMYHVEMASGQTLEVTPSHPLFVQKGCRVVPETVENLTGGDFVAVPRNLNVTGEDALEIESAGSGAPTADKPQIPDTLSPSLARLLGYIVAEGDVSPLTNRVTITDSDPGVIEDVVSIVGKLGVPWREVTHPTNDTAKVVCFHSVEFVDFLRGFAPAILDRSVRQRVPDAIMRATSPIRASFLKAYVEGEGHVATTQREITVASMGGELLEDVRSLLLSLGIQSSLERGGNGSHRLRIGGSDFSRYVDSVGFVTDRESVASRAFDDPDEDTNTDVIPDLGADLRRIRETLELPQYECGVPRTTYQHYERGDRNPGRDSLRRVVEAFEDRVEWLEETYDRIYAGRLDDVESVRQELNISPHEPADRIGVEQTSIGHAGRTGAIPDGGRTAMAGELVLDRIGLALRVTDDVRALRRIVDGDVGWDRIESIEAVEPDYDWVYDLEVEGTHNYLANDVISHNSQLLQYIRHIAPRSVYTSGKGSSAAGLTAAAVKDDFGDGQQWTLEAGALVLADKGVAAVDEVDKMASDDRSALHQALEQQEISISKAGINATLKSRCSLLGAANPKYGRFDQYEPIGEQIELEPALISRFDLIFTVTDQPDEERDRALAEHIVQTNYAGELNTQRTELSASDITDEEVAGASTDVTPAIDPDLFRKYIAYAKRNCFPRMTDGAREAITDFYVDLRSRGMGEDAPVPVTARKLEALVRLSEASARVRLSDTVDREDAERVIEIVRSSLKDIGVDPETGEFDADVVETGMSRTQQNRVRTLKALIEEIEAEHAEGAPLEVVMDRADEVGIDESKVEHEIEKLKQRGELYEPRTNHLRTT